MSVAGVSSNNTYNSGGMSYAATAKTDKRKSCSLFYVGKSITTMPSMTRITPVARLSVFGVALFANTAAILAHINVNTIHNIHTVISGIPPIAKCDTAPVNAVNAIINTLVPTAV